MKSKYLLMLLAIGASIPAIAAPLTPQQALERMNGNRPAKMAAVNSANVKHVFTSVTEQGEPAAYIFNKDNGGYMILSADEVAFPVLGYSDNGTIDTENMSPELKWWLEQYSRQIEWALQNNAKDALRGPESRAAREPIAPLMTTKWNQDAPYNDDCPMMSNRRTYTGCVATSMAQVMNYHKYPKVGQGSIAYRPNNEIGRLYLNFAKEEFDWDNMLDFYNSGSYNETQAAAVAYLMKACGYSVQMGYGIDASGTSGYTMPGALIEYFNYDKGCRSERRDMYTATDWENLMYDNLKNVGPVVINGSSPLEGGHSFVCDGYDGNGYYHINWGWGGMSDGYYALGALNPESQGIGGFSGGFNFMQNGIFGIQPPTGKEPEKLPGGVYQYGSTIASISNDVLKFSASNHNPVGWCGNGNETIVYNVGAIITPNAGGENIYVSGKVGQSTSLSIASDGSYFSAARYTPEVSLSGLNLANGSYKATLAFKRVDDENAQWEPVQVAVGNYNYVTLNVNDGMYSVTNLTPLGFNVSGVELITALFNGKFCLLKAHIANATDIELTQGLCPELFDANGKRVFTGESVLLSLNPDESLDYEWQVKFIALTGAPSITGDTKFTLKMYNPQTGTYYPGIEIPVTMGKNPGAANVLVMNAEIEGFNKGNYMHAGHEVNNVFYITETSNLTFKFNLEVVRGYMDGILRVGIAVADENNANILNPVIDQLAEFPTFFEKGDKKPFEVTFNFNEAKMGNLYYMNVVYGGTTVGRIGFVLVPAGVQDIINEANGEVEIYTLQGVRTISPRPGEVVIIRHNGKSEKRIWQ